MWWLLNPQEFLYEMHNVDSLPIWVQAMETGCIRMPGTGQGDCVPVSSSHLSVAFNTTAHYFILSHLSGMELTGTISL